MVMISDMSAALRAAAAAVKQEDDRRLFHNAALRKRRKEAHEHRVNFVKLHKKVMLEIVLCKILKLVLRLKELNQNKHQLLNLLVRRLRT